MHVSALICKNWRVSNPDSTHWLSDSTFCLILSIISYHSCDCVPTGWQDPLGSSLFWRISSMFLIAKVIVNYLRFCTVQLYIQLYQQTCQLWALLLPSALPLLSHWALKFHSVHQLLENEAMIFFSFCFSFITGYFILCITLLGCCSIIISSGYLIYISLNWSVISLIFE